MCFLKLAHLAFAEIAWDLWKQYFQIWEDFYALESYFNPAPLFGMCEFSAQLVRMGGITQKTAVSRTVNMISAELNASWLLTGNILKFMKCSSLSPMPKQMNCQTLGAGQRHSVHFSWWHLTGEHRGPVPPAHLLEQKGKKPQTEALATLTIAASPARRTDYKKSLWKSQLLLGVVAAVFC